MRYAEVHGKLADYRQQITAIREKMRETLAAIEPEEVRDYEFTNTEGTVRLSELFGPHEDLILIHNMGVSCSYCTLWADGYNGIHPQVLTRAGFAVSSPDRPSVQHKFAASRGWKFPMVSHAGSTFAADMGYVSAKGGWMPGVSDTSFSPGDDFCTLWHFFDLLPGGVGEWPVVAKKPARSAES